MFANLNSVAGNLYALSEKKNVPKIINFLIFRYFSKFRHLFQIPCYTYKPKQYGFVIFQIIVKIQICKP
jgi:hypothetical protein